jgi:hypothetical protein
MKENKKSEPEPKPEPCQNGTVPQHCLEESIYLTGTVKDWPNKEGFNYIYLTYKNSKYHLAPHPF